MHYELKHNKNALIQMTVSAEDNEEIQQKSPQKKNHVQSTVKWADIEKGIPPEQHGM